MDTFRHILNLIVPVCITLIGAVMLFAAVFGSRRTFEDNDNPNMQRMLAKFGKTKVRIFYIVFGLAVLAFGLYLLHGWLFVPQ